MRRVFNRFWNIYIYIYIYIFVGPAGNYNDSLHDSLPMAQVSPHSGLQHLGILEVLHQSADDERVCHQALQAAGTLQSSHFPSQERIQKPTEQYMPNSASKQGPKSSNARNIRQTISSRPNKVPFSGPHIPLYEVLRHCKEGRVLGGDGSSSVAVLKRSIGQGTPKNSIPIGSMGLPHRILNINHKKELLWSLWVDMTILSPVPKP